MRHLPHLSFVSRRVEDRTRCEFRLCLRSADAPAAAGPQDGPGPPRGGRRRPARHLALWCGTWSSSRPSWCRWASWCWPPSCATNASCRPGRFGQRLLGRRRDGDAVALARQGTLQRPGDGRFVIDDQDVSAGSFAGHVCLARCGGARVLYEEERCGVDPKAGHVSRRRGVDADVRAR